MKKEELLQYRAIKKEMENIQRRLDRLSVRKHKYGEDTVMSSSPHLPYTKRNITIRGYGYDASNDYKKSKLIKKLKKRLKDCSENFEKIQAFIDSIDDSAIRQIIEYKYIDGLSWPAVATEIFGYPCGDRVRKIAERFLVKC